MGSFNLFHSQEPINVRAQNVRERLKFVIQDVTVIVFDFGNCRPVELNAEPGESS